MTTIREFSLESARRYLQSVVFVDDEIYVDLPGKVAPVVEIASEMTVFKIRKSETDASAHVAPVAKSESVEASPQYHPKQLVESFARERMVCALYEPTEGFATDNGSEIFRLCERADIVILDWDLYGQDGRNILPLLLNLVSQSQTEVPHHVRLCAIYTTKPDLIKVTSQIFDFLSKEGLKIGALSSTKLDAGSSRVIILGKPTVGRPAEQVDIAEVAESKLAERIIQEFAAMHEGILPSMALHGMASVRTSAKKILDKFGSNLDAAFLVHRALILPSDDAYEQIPELLAEEVLAVMEDNPVGREITEQLSNELIVSRNIVLNWPAKDKRPAAAPGQIANGILKGGLASVKSDFKPETQPNWIDALHTAMGADENRSAMRLAALFNVRTKYSSRKDLTFGTIVRRAVDDTFEYSMCLMPICDSIRLSNKNDLQFHFPFWKFYPSNNSPSARGIVVQIADDEFIEMFSYGKPRDRFWMQAFAAGTRGTVEATRKNDTDVFESPAGDIQWVAQLKPSHAQRIAQDVGTSFSRVGLVEAEWLRLKSEKR